MENYCPITAHKIVKQYNKPNYLGARLKVDSQLNLDQWKKELVGYWDSQLIDLLYFGFPLDFNRGSPLQWEGSNHKSATEYPGDIEAYLTEELQYKAIVGPFDHHPCPGGHISPFLTREKPNSDNRRVIVDLSWPLGQSVNAGIDKTSYLGTDFLLTLPTIDHITDQLKALGKGCHLYKIDISRAFRHIKVDPLDYDLLGLSWCHVYVDTCVPFGTKHGFQIFQHCSEAMRYIMRQNGHKIVGYIDDYVGFGVPSEARASYDFLYQLLGRLGLTISSKKLVPPSTKVTCLGIEIDTVTGSVSIPEEKLQKISEMVHEWTGKKQCTKRQLQSLGNLLYIYKCVKPARIFLNRMLQVLRNAHGHTRITLDHNFYRDLRWFQTFLPKFNGVSLYDHRPVDFQVHLDACLQGLGGVFNNLVYHLSIPLGYQNLDIVHLEMINILVAVKLFGAYWKSKRVKIFCDNMAVVCVLQSGRTKDPYMAACARNIWLWSASYDIDFQFVHIAGKTNVTADLLSRWTQCVDNDKKLHSLVPNAQWQHVSLGHLDLNNDI